MTRFPKQTENKILEYKGDLSFNAFVRIAVKFYVEYLEERDNRG